MARFTFICEEECIRVGEFDNLPGVKRTTEFEAITLDEILLHFENFLRGSGFFIDGQLDFVNENEPIQYAESDFDFSEIPENNWPFGAIKPGSM